MSTNSPKNLRPESGRLRRWLSTLVGSLAFVASAFCAATGVCTPQPVPPALNQPPFDDLADRRAQLMREAAG